MAKKTAVENELIAGLKESQVEFAALLNVKAPTMSAWEQGLNVPSGAAVRLFQALESDPTLAEKLIA